MAKNGTNGEVSTSEKSAKTTRADFSDIALPDAIRLVVNTAVAARDSGHDLIKVQTAAVHGKVGIVIWIEGWAQNTSGVLVEVAPPSDVATSGDGVEPA